MMPLEFRFHIIAAYLSYVIFFIASVAALLYLIQNNALKHKTPKVIFSRLPDLSFLDKLNYGSISLGFPVLTFSIISGFVRANNIYGTFWASDNSRQLFSVILWVIYALILHVRLSAKLRGRKVAILSLFAFALIIISLFGACH